MCAHAYTVRKWPPSKRVAAAVCCEWHMTWDELEVLKTQCIAGPVH